MRYKYVRLGEGYRQNLQSVQGGGGPKLMNIKRTNFLNGPWDR